MKINQMLQCAEKHIVTTQVEKAREEIRQCKNPPDVVEWNQRVTPRHGRFLK